MSTGEKKLPTHFALIDSRKTSDEQATGIRPLYLDSHQRPKAQEVTKGKAKGAAKGVRLD